MPTDIAHTETQPASQAELCRLLLDNSNGDARPLYPVGGRTALHFGRPIKTPGLLVSTGEINRVVDFPARDMTVTVEAGIRMDELADQIAAERLQLPIDVPQRNRATLGGIVACNTSGPRRFGYGTLRDYVIGVSAVDASGRSFKAGGRVVKNVAGYDLCKLLIGSLGTLAVITQLTLKLKPIPETTAALWVELPNYVAAEELIKDLLAGDARPSVVDVLTTTAAKQVIGDARLDLPARHPALVLVAEGTASEVAWQIMRLRDEIASEWPKSINNVSAADTPRLLDALTEFPIGAEEPLTFQASLPGSRTLSILADAEATGISCLARAGNGTVIGHLSEVATTAESASQLLAPLRKTVEADRGGFVILNCAEDWKPHLPIFGNPPGSWPLMRRIKQQLDPRNLLNPGRLFADAVE